MGGRKKPILIIIGIIVLGIVSLQLSRAATTSLTSKPGTGAARSPAAIGSDSTASGGKYAKFSSPGSSFSFTAAGDHAYGTESRASMDTGRRFQL